ncbi:MAG: hypothetical protein SFT92_02250 [Rickettsiales bacterium]|nr:hypothetical protein [Rickettsiales bacterium]
MSRRDHIRPDEDDAGVLGAVAQGRAPSLNGYTALDAGNIAAGLVPTHNAAGVMTGLGTAASFAAVPLSSIKEYLDTERDQKKLKGFLGGLTTGQLTALSHHNEAVREELNSRGSRMVDAGLGAGAGAGLGLAGSAAAVAMLGSNPAGWAVLAAGAVGGIGGGIGGSKLYDKLFATERQQTVKLVEGIQQKQAQGQPIEPEEVFAVLAASVRGPEGTRIRSQLKREAGTTLFRKALESEKGRAAIQKMMTDPSNDMALSSHTGLMMDFQTGMTITDQYAALLNSKQIEAPALMINRDNLAQLMTMEKQMGVAQPAPDLAMAGVDSLPEPRGGGRRGRA